jgi:hypothetical protein
MALDKETVTATNATTFQEQASAGAYAVVSLLVCNNNVADVVVTIKVDNTTIVKEFVIPGKNTLVWDKKLLLAQDSTISIVSSLPVDIMLTGMVL